MNLLENINYGLIITERSSLKVVYQNATASQWFGEEATTTLPALLPDLLEDQMLRRTGRSKAFTQDFTLDEQDSVRKRHIELRATQLQDEEYPDHLLIECSDISKVREQEALLESYVKLVQKQVKEIEEANQKNEDLLLNILPRKVMDELKDRGTTAPEAFDNVTIMFIDFIDFTKMEVSRDPEKLFAELNEIYTRFDDIATAHKCERIKTIGDAYLAVSGLPEPDPEHATNIARTAKEIVRYLQERNAKETIQWKCRIGVHSGSIIGGVVGIRKYIYDVFGDAINTASRMQSYSDEMRINLSAESSAQLNPDEFKLTPRRLQEVKGKGEMQMFYLEP